MPLQFQHYGRQFDRLRPRSDDDYYLFGVVGTQAFLLSVPKNLMNVLEAIAQTSVRRPRQAMWRNARQAKVKPCNARQAGGSSPARRSRARPSGAACSVAECARLADGERSAAHRAA